MVDKEQYFPVLRSVTIFSGIDEAGLHRLFDQCRILSYPTGSRIVQEGDLAQEIYVLLTGKVKIVLCADDDPLELIELGPGHCVGEASVIGIQTHSASAITVEDTLVLELTRKTLMGISQFDKDLFSLVILNIARELARRLHRTDEILLHYSPRKSRHDNAS